MVTPNKAEDRDILATTRKIRPSGPSVSSSRELFFSDLQTKCYALLYHVTARGVDYSAAKGRE